ncbi:MAG: hypothetical protein ABIP94_24505 [Planctomycetota bacterium]
MIIDAANVDATPVDGEIVEIDAASIDAASIDGASIDGVSIDGAAIDGAVIDGAVIDAASIDAAIIDGAITDAPAIDAAVTTQSSWTAASGVTPDSGCAPWTLVDTSTPEGPVLAAGQLTLGNDADGEALYYLHPAAVLAMPPVLVIDARVRFGAGGSQTASRSGAGISYAFGDTDRKNTLFIDDGVVFLLSAENTRGPSHVAPTTDAAHTYRIEATAATGTVQVFRDGVPILTGTSFVSTYDVPTAIYFGEASVVAHGTSHWESVSHNALAPVACP